MIHKFEMRAHEDAIYSDVYVDGEKVNKSITGIEFEQFAGELPTVLLHMRGVLDVKTFANVLYVANEESVEAATKYLRESVEKDEALRDEFESRILSAIDKLGSSCDCEELAHKILDMIFVEESR